MLVQEIVLGCARRKNIFSILYIKANNSLVLRRREWVISEIIIHGHCRDSLQKSNEIE